MMDELYAAGWESITGYDETAGWEPAYTGAYVPQYASGALIPQYASGAAIPVYAGWDTITGAPVPVHPAHPAHPAHRRLRGAPARIAYGSSLGMEKRDEDQPRLYPLNFFLSAVPASGSDIATSRPQILFRPQRLVVPATIATNFLINDIRVGKDSMLAQAGAMAAEIFTQTAVGVMMTLDTAQKAIDVSISVTNTDAVAAHDFRATWFGASLDK